MSVKHLFNFTLNDNPQIVYYVGYTFNYNMTLSGSRSKKDKKIVDAENKIRIQKKSYGEHPQAKGIHKQKKPLKKHKVEKSHNAIK